MKHKRISLHSLSSIWKRKCDLTSPSVSAARLTVYHVLYRRGIFDASHFVPLELPESGGKHMVGLIITVLVVALPHFITPSPPTPPPLPLPFTTSPRHHVTTSRHHGTTARPWALPYRPGPYLTSPHLTSPHLTSPHLTSFQFMLRPRNAETTRLVDWIEQARSLNHSRPPPRNSTPSWS